MRKERGVVELNKVIKTKEDSFARREKDLQENIAAFEADKASLPIASPLLWIQRTVSFNRVYCALCPR